MALPKLKARHGIVRKPVIASLAGTTKAVSLSQRPQPPAKPRSERPLSAGGSHKPRTLAQQDSGEEMKNSSTQQSSFFGGQNRTDSGSCNDNEMLGSVNSAQNGHKRAQGGKSETFREPHKHQALSKHSSAGSSTIQSVKSTSELLEEARLIAGLQLPDEVDQQRAPNETLEDTLEGPTQRDTSVPKCFQRPPVSSGVYKMAQSVLQKDSEIVSDGRLKDLLSQATLCPSEHRMFWSPAPPKFICAPCVMKDTLFPKYQITQPDLPDLLGELHSVVESVSHVMDTKQVTSEARRSRSAPHLTPDLEPHLRLQSDFTSLSRELEHVRWQRQQNSICATLARESPSNAKQTKPQEVHTEPNSSERPCQVPNHRRNKGKERARVSRFKRRAKKRGKTLSSFRMAYVWKKLTEPSQTLTRSESLCQLPRESKTSKLQISPLLCHSLPMLLDFETFATDRGGIPDTTPSREWVRDIWDAWFDEVFPPLEIVQSAGSLPGSLEENQLPQDEIQDLDKMVWDEGLNTDDLEHEVAKLTQTLTESGNHSAFDQCRRGALYIKLGYLNQALEDLNAAISLEPHLLDAYWHRHRVYLLRNDPDRALDDLNVIVKNNKKHADALMSRAEIYKQRGETTLALFNYTQAIKVKPDDAEIYFKRAKMYEKMDKILLAMEDYAKTFTIDSTRTDAMMIHGIQHFNSSKWMQALEDFSLLLKQEPGNATARTYRGRIYSKLGQFEKSIEDLYLAVHLDPSSWLAFYHRGCLLREIMPHMALRDLSTSVLINDSAENLSAFLHRGLVYMSLRRWRQAMDDFEAVIKLDRGKYLYEMKQFDLATLCIRYAAEMKTALGLSPVQQAVVQSFLGNDANAIVCLEEAVDTCPSPAHLILLGKTLMREHRFTESEDSLLLQALDAFNSAVSMNPDHAEAHHQRGLCRVHLQDSTGVQDFNRALQINPSLYQVHLSRAALYGAQGRYAKAVLDCNEAIRIQPKSVRAYLYKGALKFYLKAYKSAVEDLTMVIQMDSACSFAYYNRGVCFQELRDYELALRDYSITLLLGCKTELELKVLINRGLLYVELNDYGSALQDFKAAAQKQPEDVIIHHALGVIHHRLGQLQEAVDAYSQALRLDPFLQDSHVGRGNVFMDYGHNHARKHAQRDFLSALHLNPLCASARISLAYNLQVLGFFQRAWNQFTVAVECNPHAEQLFTNRGLIQQFMGDKASAMKNYQTAISLNPGYALAYFNAANLFFYNGQFEQACEYYSQAFELDPSDESAILNRAITHALLRKVPASLQDFNEALCLNPLSAHAYFNRANLYCSLRQFQSAERDLTQALMLQPGDALLYKLRADVWGRLGWTEQALNDYRTAVELEDSRCCSGSENEHNEISAS
ncbi:tetratricopeptide repeat 6 [Labeo rohita]|uniref:Tetratricopeptide repeat 6 n=1 Tax=Labeo rohita TaxID=84645 RepID=A0A498MGK3_LABRO|nr:tetratricopeptide repeat 6 [Labeo rohita]